MPKEQPRNLFDERPGARALRQLRAWIQDGELTAGELLPPEQQLAERLDVSRTTVRSALGVLMDDGMIAAVAGSRGRRIICSSTVPPLLRNTVAVLADASLVDPSHSWMYPRWSLDVAMQARDLLYAKGLHALRLNPQNLHPRQLRLPPEELPMGLIVFENNDTIPENTRTLEAFARSEVPIAALTKTAPVPSASTVCPDYRRGTYDLTRWLLARGRRRILPCWTHSVGHQPPVSCADRLAGYQEAMEEAGQTPLEPVLCGLPPSEHSEAASFEASVHMAAGHLVRYINDGTEVDAILTVSDCAARVVSAAVRVLGRLPREDLDIAGFGHAAGACGSSGRGNNPSVTLALDSRQMAERLVDLALNPPAEPVQFQVRPNLIVPEESLPVFGALRSRQF